MLGSRQERLKGFVTNTKTSLDLPTKRLFSLFAAVAVNSNDSDRQQVSLYLANTTVFYPTLTNFWIVLILKSSEDFALIR